MNTAAEKTKLWTLSSDCSRITAKPTMNEPDARGYVTQGLSQVQYAIDLASYKDHTASLPSYVAIGFDKSDVGRPLEEGKDFRLQHQMTTWKKEIWYDCEEEGYNNTVEDSRRIVAYKSSLPKEQGGKSDSGFLKWMLDGNSLFFIDDVKQWVMQVNGKEIMFSKFAEVLNQRVFERYHSSPPSPEGKEAEYWKKRCEAAENLLSVMDAPKNKASSVNNDAFILFGERNKKWQDSKH